MTFHASLQLGRNDPCHGEGESWWDAQNADPEEHTRFDQILQLNGANDLLDVERLEETAADLLGREDARRLLLSEEEIASWFPAIAEILRKMPADIGPASDEPVVKSELERLGNLIWDKIGEIAQATFTPERITRLITQLRSYANDLESAGSRSEGTAITAAISLVRHETQPDKNYFLLKLCYHSVDAVLREIVATGA